MLYLIRRSIGIIKYLYQIQFPRFKFQRYEVLH